MISTIGICSSMLIDVLCRFPTSLRDLRTVSAPLVDGFRPIASGLHPSLQNLRSYGATRVRRTPFRSQCAVGLRCVVNIFGCMEKVYQQSPRRCFHGTPRITWRRPATETFFTVLAQPRSGVGFVGMGEAEGGTRPWSGAHHIP